MRVNSADCVAIPNTATIDDLPNEVLFNILEKLPDKYLYKCLTVSKRWYDLTLPQLWYHLEFAIYNHAQVRTLNRLISSEAKSLRFPLVRKVSLFVNLRGERIGSTERCQEIAQTLRHYTELLRICTGLRSVRLALHPLIESDAHRSVWQELQSSNLIIEELVEFAATKEYSEFFLDIPQPKWRFEEGLSDIYHHWVHTVGGQVTRLHLCESASLIWPWFASLKRLRRLDFENNGKPGEEALAKFWDTISQFPLEELSLSGVTFPRTRKFKIWEQSLRMINLNRFTDIEGAISTILRSFPNLRTLGLHNTNNFLSINNPVPIDDVVCVNLRMAIFTHCRPQRELTSIIAKACPNLQVCMPPDNASDSDIITLIDSCPFLVSLGVDNCNELTSVSWYHFPRARRLKSFLFNMEHLSNLNEKCILALAESCPDLHSRGCRISTMGEKNEKFHRMAMREKLSGSARFKRWLLRFITWTEEGPHLQRIIIDIDNIRREINDIGI